jgi:hypothetical protein
MNTQSPAIKLPVPTPRPVDKFDALERFCAAMQSIRMYREDIVSDPEFAEEEGLTVNLAEQIGHAAMALDQLPADWRPMFEVEFQKAVRT